MDLLLVGFIAATTYGGFRSGFLRSLLGLAFMAISFVVAAYFRYPVGAIATTFFKDVPPDYANLVGYAVAFPAVLGALHIVSRLFLGKVQVQGMSKALDSALGAIFGGVEAILIVSAGIVIAETYLGTGSTLRHALGPGLFKTITDGLAGSTTVHILQDTTVPIVLAILGPLLPHDISTLLPGGIPTGLPGGIPGLPVPSN